MSMSQQQKKYALERIDNIRKNKISEINKKHTVPARELTNREMYNLVKQGKVKLLPWAKVKFDRYEFIRIDCLYDFNKYESPRKFDNDANTKEVNAFMIKVNKAKDQIMLGDASEGLKILEELEAL